MEEKTLSIIAKNLLLNKVCKNCDSFKGHDGDTFCFDYKHVISKSGKISITTSENETCEFWKEYIPF